MPPKRKTASKATESAEAAVTVVSEAPAKKIKKSESTVGAKHILIEFSKEW